MKKKFGIFFIVISISVLIASIISEGIVFYKYPNYFHLLNWVLIFFLMFVIIAKILKGIVPSIRDRMKKSIKWPLTIKIINGISWALPFLLIPIFFNIYQYLILVGIGLGNISTFFFLKKYSGLENKEQAIIGLISLISIPFVISIDNTIINSTDLEILASRIIISVSYGVGGIFALLSKR